MRTVHFGKSYEITPAHPVADLFPWMGEDELQELADDIAANGLRQKIIKLADGRLADGRNRELACRIAGVEPQYHTLSANTPDDQVVRSIISANLKRRHLTPSQKAMVAAKLETITHGGNRRNQDAPVHLESNRAKLAEITGASVRSIASAAKVLADAPELVPVVDAGELDVKTAEKVADLDPEEREEIAESDDPKEEADKRLATRKRGSSGPAIDPDHPHADLLRAITSLAGRISAACNDADPDAKIRTYLLTHELVYPRAKIVNGRAYGWQCRFLRGVYRLVKLAGLPGRVKTRAELVKEYDEALGLEDDQ